MSIIEEEKTVDVAETTAVEEEEKKKKRKFWIWFFVLAGGGLILLFGAYKLTEDFILPMTGGRSVKVDPNAGDKKKKANEAASKGIEIPGYPELHFPAGATTVEVPLENPASNPCYFKYTLKLVDTGEVLYTSEDIPPGKTVNAETLSRGLEPGEYNAVFEVRTLSLAEPHVAMNGADLKTKIVVK
ncbi:MAG: hypothetical protein LBS41_05490 [Streptococcaceae bacterium]|jgi:hypothetical protein|nr:hypothetical protein [Streptococcaceae bacterium]